MARLVATESGPGRLVMLAIGVSASLLAFYWYRRADAPRPKKPAATVTCPSTVGHLLFLDRLKSLTVRAVTPPTKTYSKRGKGGKRRKKRPPLEFWVPSGMVTYCPYCSLYLPNHSAARRHGRDPEHSGPVVNWQLFRPESEAPALYSYN